MSSYNPAKQGRRDGQRGSARFIHQSERNQRLYDATYEHAYTNYLAQARSVAAPIRGHVELTLTIGDRHMCNMLPASAWQDVNVETRKAVLRDLLEDLLEDALEYFEHAGDLNE